MSKAQPWYWELAQRGGGPDWHLLATFAPSGAAALADAALTLGHMGYTRVPAVAQGADTITLIDSYHADVYIENSKEGSAQRNIMVYRLIEIEQASIHATYAYGWAEGDDALTKVLLGLLATSGVALGAWQVQAGGEGYDYTTVRQGADGASLTIYLAEA